MIGSASGIGDFFKKVGLVGLALSSYSLALGLFFSALGALEFVDVLLSRLAGIPAAASSIDGLFDLILGLAYLSVVADLAQKRGGRRMLSLLTIIGMTTSIWQLSEAVAAEFKYGWNSAILIFVVPSLFYVGLLFFVESKKVRAEYPE